MIRGFAVSLVLTTLGLGLYGCGDDNRSPTSPSSVPTGPPLTAPVIQSPEIGANIKTTTPMLTVGNASGGSGPRTYQFDIAADPAFTEILITETEVEEGEEDTTSWRVSPPLDPGPKYYWRARAATSAQQGPFSEVAEFIVVEGFAFTRRTGGLVVFDPLTSGFSVGEVVGGEFTTQGWMSTGPDDYIRYQVPTLSEGFVEFEVTNIREPNPVPGKRMLMIMWDPTKGEYTTNPFRMHLRKMDRNTVNRWDVRLRWVSRGQVRDEGISFFDFEADIIYPWRVEWGSFPGNKAQQVRVFLEGLQVLTRNYDPIYHPKNHWVELGGAPRSESLEEAVYSNVRIGSR